jgi:hypothetical protein
VNCDEKVDVRNQHLHAESLATRSAIADNSTLARASCDARIVVEA